MQRFNTGRLFFGKFPYKILLKRIGNINDQLWENEITPKKLHEWLRCRKIHNRIYTKINYTKDGSKNMSVFMNIFVESEKDFKEIKSEFSDYVVSVTQPIDDSHIDVLKDNTNVIIRNSLLYKRFRYVISFTKKYHYLQQVEEDNLNIWINDTFLKNVNDSEIKWDRFKWHQMGWNPRLYLSDESDLILVKLTWAERIRSITIIHTYDELKGYTNNP